jgi:hypothetical protein
MWLEDHFGNGSILQRNERVKLAASFWNNIGAGMVIGGVAAALFLDRPQGTWTKIGIAIAGLVLRWLCYSIGSNILTYMHTAPQERWERLRRTGGAGYGGNVKLSDSSGSKFILDRACRASGGPIGPAQIPSRMSESRSIELSRRSLYGHLPCFGYLSSLEDAVAPSLRRAQQGARSHQQSAAAHL